MTSAVTTFGSTTVNSTFVYDGEGTRVKKIVGTTTTRYISKLYECDTTGANTSCSRFIWANETRVATVAVTSGAVHYWHGDHLGSSSVITDSTGAKVQALTYYPYGDVRTNVPGTPINVPYKFTGKELDASSNLYFYESRYYHAIFGRFIAPDTIVPDLSDPQSLNRYTYANNNPLRYTDPNGHFPVFAIVVAIGVVAGAVSSGIQSDWDLQATLLGGVIGGVSAAVGYGTFGPAMQAFASLGSVGSGIAGGAVAGAAAGGTSGILANMAGYNVNIGLAIASGAAAGGIGGGAYGYGLGTSLGGGLTAALAAPAAGASAAAISGADPGMGAAIAAATAAFALGVKVGYEIVRNWDVLMANLEARQNAAMLLGFTADIEKVSVKNGQLIAIGISKDAAGKSVNLTVEAGDPDGTGISGLGKAHWRTIGAATGVVQPNGKIFLSPVDISAYTQFRYMRLTLDYQTLSRFITGFRTGCNPCNFGSSGYADPEPPHLPRE